MPGRPDRRLADPERAAALLEDVDLLPVDDRRAREVRRERVGVRDVVCVQGSGEADRDDQDEEGKRSQGDAVAKQPAPGEAPGALTCELLCALAGREAYILFRLVGEFSRALPPTSRTPGRAGSTTAGST